MSDSRRTEVSTRPSGNTLQIRNSGMKPILYPQWTTPSFNVIQGTVAARKSGRSPGRNLPTRLVVNLRNCPVIINQSISVLARVHFLQTSIWRAIVP
jgi:hypothetical protein